MWAIRKLGRRFLKVGRTGPAPPRPRLIEQLADLLARDPEGVSRQISPADEMFQGHTEHYFGVGRSALKSIHLALLAAAKDPQHVTRILDLPSGAGRVLRSLRAAFPDAAIVACDLLRDGVDFCAREFGAVPVYAAEHVGLGDGPPRFDLIWCGSLLTHLDEPRWAEFLDLFDRLLDRGGVLIFTVHGRIVPGRMTRGWDYGLPVESLLRLVKAWKQTGFGYVDYPGQHGYGISVAAPWWTARLLQRWPQWRLVFYSEYGWDGHQDVVACSKETMSPPRGPESDRLSAIDFGI
jgi:SAM-dependent methyltransferase